MTTDQSPTSLSANMRDLVIAHSEKLRYLFVGGWNTFFGYALFLVLLATVGRALQGLETSTVPPLAWTGDNYYLVVGWIGWVLSVPQSTLTMKYLVFRSKGRALREIGRAYFVYLPSQWVGTAILWSFVELIGLSPQLGALATTTVTVILSYLGHKYFTFRRPTI